MNLMKTRRSKVTLAIVVTLVAAMAISTVAYPAFATLGEQAVQAKEIEARAKGWAFQKIDNETIRMKPAEMNLTLELGERKDHRIGIINVTGTLDINGTTYTIESGNGIIQTVTHTAWLHCKAQDAQGSRILLQVHAVYFWWGGRLYAFRARAVVHNDDTRMLLLLRGVARVE